MWRRVHKVGGVMFVTDGDGEGKKIVFAAAVSSKLERGVVLVSELVSI